MYVNHIKTLLEEMVTNLSFLGKRTFSSQLVLTLYTLTACVTYVRALLKEIKVVNLDVDCWVSSLLDRWALKPVCGQINFQLSMKVWQESKFGSLRWPWWYMYHKTHGRRSNKVRQGGHTECIWIHDMDPVTDLFDVKCQIYVCSIGGL